MVCYEIQYIIHQGGKYIHFKRLLVQKNYSAVQGRKYSLLNSLKKHLLFYQCTIVHHSFFFVTLQF